MSCYRSLVLCCLSLLTSTACHSPSTPNTQRHAFRVASDYDPESLDPRAARDLTSASVLHMLFEGLLRVDHEGNLQPAAASGYTVSDDRLTYTFTLRDNHWSNGDLVTASDFVYAWRTLLDPSFAAPNAFQLFPIKNAEAVKKGTVSPELLGAYAQDPQTLVVTLEKPTVHFPELTTFHALMPVNARVAQEHPHWAEGGQQYFTSNGPFALDHWKLQSEVVLVKNPHYWDKEAIHLDQITVVPGANSTALKLFEQGELDWIGSPMSMLPPDAIPFLKEQGSLSSSPSAGTHWFRLNTEKPPLNDLRIRKALALALNRESLIEHILQGNQQVAGAIVPPTHGWIPGRYIADQAYDEARALLQDATQGKPLPPMTLTYGFTERHHKIAQAVQHQWREVLGVDVTLEALEPKTFYARLKADDYMIANGGWFADFRDPINFLNVFKAKDNGTNHTGWENADYHQLLDLAAAEPNAEKRNALMKNAEAILMENVPVVPVFYYTFDYQKNPRIQNVGVTELGILNIRDAQIAGD